VHLISNAICAMTGDPALRAGLLREPERLPLAVEEFMRFYSPVMMSKMNFAREALVFEGVSLPKGARVSAFLLGANHDPARRDDPGTLVPDRRPNAHLGFGFGPHTCLGMQLARLEARVALERLFTRYPEATFAGGEPPFARRFGIRGRDKVMLHLRP